MDDCPRCEGFILADRETGEPYCINCGWRAKPFARQTLTQKLLRAMALRQPSKYHRGLCRRCQHARLPESVFCGECQIVVRDRAKQYMRKRYGYKPWQPGKRGRPPVLVMA